MYIAREQGQRWDSEEALTFKGWSENKVLGCISRTWTLNLKTWVSHVDSHGTQ